MLSSKRLFLSLGLAFSTLLCPFLKMWIPSSPSKPARSQFRGKVSRLVRKSLSGRVSISTPEERAASPSRKTYDQAKVDLIKAEIIEIYKDCGTAVGADSSLEPTRDRRAVRILIE